MKKILLVLLTLTFCSTIVQAKQPSKPTNFSGNWALDLGETKNPPAGLQHYSMVVNQDEQQLAPMSRRHFANFSKRPLRSEDGN